MKEDLIEKTIEREKLFVELFKELELKPAQCELIRAFLIVSEGKVEFEASFYDLAKVNHKTDGTNYQKLTDKVRYAFRTLNEWQQENKLTLIEIAEKGYKENSPDDGKFIYHKTEYRFVFLAELAKVFNEDFETVRTVIEETIIRLRECFVPVEKPRKYHPHHLMRKAKNTIFTKLKRVFHFAVEAGDNPVSYCQEILNDCWEILTDLENEYEYSKNRESFITDFENELNIAFMEESEEEMPFSN